MALNTRLTQNIDLQADATALRDALRSIGTEIKSIVGNAGSLNKALQAGSKVDFNSQLKILRNLVSQATALQNIMDGVGAKRTGRGKGLLDEQALGRQSSAASKLARDLGTTDTAAAALEKRLTLLNDRFAQLAKTGQTVSRNDLSKQLRIDQALKQVNSLQGAITRLNGKALNTPTGGSSPQMVALRTQIEAINEALLRTAQNTRRSNFQPQIDQLRALVEQYQKLIAVEIREAEVTTARGLKANSTAQNILNQTDSQRAATVQRAATGYAFQPGISNTTTAKQTEDQMALLLNRRLSLLAMIKKAQDTGASTAIVERLNTAYGNTNNKLGEQYKILTQINAEKKKSFAGQFETGLGYAGKIAGASLAVTGVYALINGLQQASQFVVQYEAALKNLQAISGSTDEQTRRLAGGIAEVSANANASVLDITKAAQVIAQAGYSAKETIDVLKASITLSTAAGVDPNTGADVITSTLGAFQLQASQSAKIADTLVTALNETKLSIDQVQAAIQYAGATAKESGVGFTELTTIIASLSQAGIKSGSTIGTGLRQLLVDLQTPTEDFKKNLKDFGLTLADIDVKSLGFANVVKNLTKAGFDASAAYSSFETRAAAAFLAFKGQLGTYDQLAVSLARGGAAAEAQEKAMDSLGAQWTRLTNILSQSATLMSGPLLDAFKVIVEVLSGVFGELNRVIGLFADLTGKSDTLSGVLRILGGAIIGSFFGPVGAVTGAVLGLISAIGGMNRSLDEAKTKLSDSSSAYDSQQQKIVSVDNAISDLIQKQDSLKDGSTDLQVETINLSQQFEGLNVNLDSAKVKYQDLLTAMIAYSQEARREAGLLAETKKQDAITLRDQTSKKLDSAGQTVFGGQSDLGSLRNTLFPTASKTPNAPLSLQNQITNALYKDKNADTIRATLNTTKAARNTSNDPRYDYYIQLLQQRLALAEQLRSATAQIAVADKEISLSNATLTTEYTSSESELTKVRALVQNGMRNEDQSKGTGKATLDRALAQIDIDIDIIKQKQQKYKEGSAQYQALGQLIDQNTALKNQIVRKARIESEDKPDKAGKGKDLLAPAVAADLRTAFPGANVYGTSARSLADQKRYYAKYKAGTGPLAAKPGSSYHGSQHAIDMTPISGMNIDQIVAYIESLGLEVVEKLVERNPRGGGVHWHIAWKTKTSNFQNTQDAALASLEKARASSKVGASSARIQAILAQARAGTGDPATLQTQLSSAITDYSKAVIEQYDTDHPVEGLKGAALAEWKLGRAEVLKKVKEDSTKFQADFFKQVADFAKQTYDQAIQSIDDELKRKTYEGNAPVRASDRLNTVAGNRINKGHIDSGTQYYLDKRAEDAQIQSDRARASATDDANIQKSVQLAKLETATNAMPSGPEKQAQLASIRTEWEKLTEAMAANDELWDSINARVERFTELPLADRLKYGAQAWLEQSGAMDSYKDVLAKNVGPALDMVTDQLSNMFVQLATGQMTLKKALIGMIKAIGEFVLQMIAKALALAAIKWFLKMIGVEVPDGGASFGGGHEASHGLTGGRVGAGGITPRYRKGGPIKLRGGGNPYITSGVTNKDTMPALLAKGEYVVRSAAVEDIGVAQMDAINKMGSKAISGMQKPTMIMPQSKQEVNVYVVKPEERPPTTKNDIVLAVTDDMLQGGVTKQLVRQISQGG